MDFSLNEDQLAMRDATRRFLEAEYPRELRGTSVNAATALARWAALADMGLAGLPLQARWGGGGAGMVEMTLVAREMGRCHAGEDLLSSLVLAGLTLQVSGNDAHCAQWLPRLASGQARLALAYAEPDSRYQLHHVRTRAEPLQDGQGYELDGQKALVLGAAQAAALLVLARTQGAVDDNNGLSLFLVPCDAPGLRMQTFGTLDGRHAAHVSFDAVRVRTAELVGPLHGAAALVRAAVRRGAIWCCAESLGVMDSLISDTAEYVMARRQFGAPLSRFQVLQHRLADGLIALEESEAITFAAAMWHDDATRDDLLDRTTAAAKVITGRAGQRISETAIQLHGAMGMTDACRVGHLVKRLATLNLLFGDVHHHTGWYAAHRFAGPDAAPTISPKSDLGVLAA